MHIEVYNPNVNAYRANNIVKWARDNRLGAVIELHRNSFGTSSANGYETIVHPYQSSPMMASLHKEIAKIGWSNRGIKTRTNLANVNRTRKAGIPYSLLELGFISNARDNNIYDSNISNIVSIIKRVAKQSGIKRLGIVYGHGAGDPGACNNNRTEANDVRRLNFKVAPKKEEPKLTKNEVVNMIKDIMKPSRNGEKDEHWAKESYDNLLSKGVNIEEKRFNDAVKRGEMFAMLDRITDMK